MKKLLILFLAIASIRVSAFNTGAETKNVIYIEIPNGLLILNYSTNYVSKAPGQNLSQPILVGL